MGKNTFVMGTIMEFPVLKEKIGIWPLSYDYIDVVFSENKKDAAKMYIERRNEAADNKDCSDLMFTIIKSFPGKINLSKSELINLCRSKNHFCGRFVSDLLKTKNTITIPKDKRKKVISVEH